MIVTWETNEQGVRLGWRAGCLEPDCDMNPFTKTRWPTEAEAIQSWNRREVSDEQFTAYQQRIGLFVLNRLAEVHNNIGGVIGYKLELDADETEQLLRLIENEPLSQGTHPQGEGAPVSL